MISKPFSTRIGVVGGGQLGKMLIESANRMNVSFNILENDPNAPSARYATHFVQGALTDSDAIRRLAELSDVITYEIEHIDVETLIELEAEGKKVYPAPGILKIIQDKGLQKSFYSEHHLPTSKYILVEEILDCADEIDALPGEKLVVKSRKGGYDGKGVAITTRQNLSSEFPDLPFDGPCLIEEFIENAVELSVIVARNSRGEEKAFPSCEMVFDPELNLVDHLYSPANLSNEQEQELERIAKEAILKMDGVGLFAVEFFMTKEGDFLINEIAPRPHNSGHHTIEANITSQYEQLMRILLDLPLGNTALRSPAVMINLIGPAGVTGDYEIEGLDDFHAIEGTSLHWYNKEVTKPGRKMGHFTVCAPSVDLALERANEARKALRIVAAS